MPAPIFFYQKDIIAENFVGKKKDPPVAPFYPPVNKHNYGKLSMYRRFTHQTCLLSIATLVYQVIQFQWMNYGYEPVTKTKWDDPPSK